MNPLDNSSAPPTIRHGVLYTVFHAGGGEDAQEFFPLFKKFPHPPPQRIKNISKQYSFTSHLFFFWRERERCAYLQHHHLFWKKPTSILYSTYMYLVVLHNIHNQLPQLIWRIATVLHTVVHVHLCTAF